jgi:hypothetical protein
MSTPTQMLLRERSVLLAFIFSPVSLLSFFLLLLLKHLILTGASLYLYLYASNLQWVCNEQSKVVNNIK